ncbi:MAG: hypothetical protein LBT56_04040 [Prevotellaceae bacterium]|jgi:hypothetical protein|nr:hypothetical protein [Prevotellaceae bacterium]
MKATSRLPERQDFHNRRATTCGKKSTLYPLSERQDFNLKSANKFCLSGSGKCYLFPQATAYALPAVIKILPRQAKRHVRQAIFKLLQITKIKIITLKS